MGVRVDGRSFGEDEGGADPVRGRGSVAAAAVAGGSDLERVDDGLSVGLEIARKRDKAGSRTLRKEEEEVHSKVPRSKPTTTRAVEEEVAAGRRKRDPSGMRGEGAERRRNGDDWEEEVGLDEEMALGGGGCDEGREAEGELEQRRGEGEGSFARKDRLLNEDMCSRMMLGGLEKEEGEETGCEGKEGLGSDGPTSEGNERRGQPRQRRKAKKGLNELCERSSKVGCRAYGIYYVEIL